MAHNLTSEDGLALAQRPAWHGLGDVLPSAPTVRESTRVAGLGWRVLRRPVLADVSTEYVSAGNRGTGPVLAENLRAVPDVVAIQREDTGRILGTVSGDYYPFQNADLADLVDATLSTGGVGSVAVESAGSLGGGRRVFYLARRPDFLARPGTRDVVADYVLFSNAHDGSASVGIIPTTVRVVCANTLAMAEAGSGFRVRHSADVMINVKAAARAFQLAMAGGDRARATIERLAAVPMDDEDRRVFFLKVYEAAVGVIPARPRTEEESRAAAKAVETVAKWVANLDSARNTGTGTEGTVWHALNAVTEWSDHGRTVRAGSGTVREARAASALFGTSAQFKAKALRVAVAVAG